MKVTKILGVDPGTTVLGYSIIEIHGDQIQLLDIGIIKLDTKSDHQTRLKEIFLQLQEVIETYLPHVMAIEAPFFGKNVQSMLKLGRAQGVAMAAAMTMGLEIAEYSPKKIKKAVTGNGNAAKEQVASMLTHLISKDIKHASLDATDALATAYCHYLKISGAQMNTPKQHGNWASFLKDNPGRIR
ncbi:MAG: crossover junction endodeoxyribonuclease RuvC [Bacteroidetes bacterium]|nr:MAG: crossover junction endodeoxyribonuclease RuvC [Bacteroidota bacterium]